MALIEKTVDTAGAAGNAAGSVQTDELWLGFLDMVQLVYNAAAPATTTVVVKEARKHGRELLRVENNKTSGAWYPRHDTHKTDGSKETGQGDMFLTSGPLIVEVSGCDALEAAVEVVLQIAYQKNLL